MHVLNSHESFSSKLWYIFEISKELCTWNVQINHNTCKPCNISFIIWHHYFPNFHSLNLFDILLNRSLPGQYSVQINLMLPDFTVFPSCWLCRQVLLVSLALGLVCRSISWNKTNTKSKSLSLALNAKSWWQLGEIMVKFGYRKIEMDWQPC